MSFARSTNLACRVVLPIDCTVCQLHKRALTKRLYMISHHWWRAKAVGATPWRMNSGQLRGLCWRTSSDLIVPCQCDVMTVATQSWARTADSDMPHLCVSIVPKLPQQWRQETAPRRSLPDRLSSGHVGSAIGPCCVQEFATPFQGPSHASHAAKCDHRLH